MFRKNAFLVFFALAFAALAPHSFGQDEKSKGEEKQEKQTEIKVLDPVPIQLATPRATLRTFLEAVPAEDYKLAASCLDLEKNTSSSKRKTLCDKLYVLLHDAWKVDPEAIPDSETGQAQTLDSAIGIVDNPAVAEDANRVNIAKSPDGRWVFTEKSIELVDEELYDRWVGRTDLARTTKIKLNFPMWLEGQIPAEWVKKNFLIKDYQWVALLVLLLAGFAVDFIVRTILNVLTHRYFRKAMASGDKTVRKNLWKPVGLLLNALTWYFGASLIDLPSGFLLALQYGLKWFAVFAYVWTAFSAINLLGDYMLRKANKKASRYEYILVPFIKMGLRILVVCIGLAVSVDVFNLKWQSLLGGLGVGGIAIAIASKEVLGNVFGSITVLTDRPFEIGDWVITEGVEGEVESVGMRSSRIRTFYNSLVVLPNSRLTTAIVDNMGRRNYRRVKMMIGVEYSTTPDQLEAFCSGIRELIRQNESTRKDYFHVYVNEFGPSSINILVYFFLKTPDWSGELYEKHSIMIQVIRLAKSLNVGLAFPTQTIHLQRDEPRDSGLDEIDSPRDLGKEKANEAINPE